MVWVDVEDGFVGGGMEFFMLKVRSVGGGDICCFVECDEFKEGEENKGIVFKVKLGNVVYWENFVVDGRGYDEIWYVVLLVEKGVKVGLNIWIFGCIE